MADNRDKRCFIDSNIWLYALVTADDEQKTVSAATLIAKTVPVVSTQVINEVCVNLVKKAGFTESQIRQLVGSFYMKCRVVQLSRTILVSASHLREQYSLSYWDSNKEKST